MTLRTRIAAILRADSQIAGMLAGGVYPLVDTDPSVMDPKYYPLACDAFGEMHPTALVRDGGSFPSGPTGMGGSQSIVDVLLWQGRGRDVIEAALPLIRKLLDGVRADTSGLYVYRLTFAGESTALRDPALQDAEHAWSRWQSATVLK